jgi:nucleoside phosphorylase
MPLSDSRAYDVLIVAAHAVELAPLQAALGATLGGDAAAPVERGALRVSTRAVGVGLATAGAGTARAVAGSRPRAILLVGSFGAYQGGGATLASLLAPDDTTLLDESVLSNRAAAPSAMPVRARVDEALREGLSRAADVKLRGTLATTAFITTDDALAASLSRSGCVGENLEAVAVGLACEAHGVPWAALLACTNDVGSRGRAQWLAEHARAAAQTSAVVLAWLDQGAPGLLRADDR